MTIYPMPRASTFGIIGKFAVAIVAVVVIQGILSFKFTLFGFFDLPLIFSVFYGFTLGNPVASILSNARSVSRSAATSSASNRAPRVAPSSERDREAS